MPFSATRKSVNATIETRDDSQSDLHQTHNMDHIQGLGPSGLDLPVD